MVIPKTRTVLGRQAFYQLLNLDFGTLLPVSVRSDQSFICHFFLNLRLTACKLLTFLNLRPTFSNYLHTVFNVRHIFKALTILSQLTLFKLATILNLRLTVFQITYHSQVTIFKLLNHSQPYHFQVTYHSQLTCFQITYYSQLKTYIFANYLSIVGSQSLVLMCHHLISIFIHHTLAAQNKSRT